MLSLFFTMPTFINYQRSSVAAESRGLGGWGLLPSAQGIHEVSLRKQRATFHLQEDGA